MTGRESDTGDVDGTDVDGESGRLSRGGSSSTPDPSSGPSDSADDADGTALDADTDEVIETLNARQAVLTALTDGPVGKPALTDGLPVSRSTVDRSIRRLEAAGFVERADGGWRATLAGRLAAASFEKFADRVAGVLDGRPLLEYLDEELSPPPELFADGEVFTIGQDLVGSAVGRRMATFFADIDRCIGLANHANPDVVDVLQEAVVDGGAEGRFVFDAATLSYAVSTFRDQFTAMLESGRLELHTVERLPCGLYVVEADDTAQVAVVAYDDLERSRAVAISDAPVAVAWARTTITDYLAATDRVHPLE